MANRTSNQQNPVVNYQEAGSFDVTLTVLKDGESNTITKPDYIHAGGSQIQIDTLNYPLAGEYAFAIQPQGVRQARAVGAASGGPSRYARFGRSPGGRRWRTGAGPARSAVHRPRNP